MAQAGPRRGWETGVEQLRLEALYVVVFNGRLARRWAVWSHFQASLFVGRHLQEDAEVCIGGMDEACVACTAQWHQHLTPPPLHNMMCVVLVISVVRSFVLYRFGPCL